MLKKSRYTCWRLEIWILKCLDITFETLRDMLVDSAFSLLFRSQTQHSRFWPGGVLEFWISTAWWVRFRTFSWQFNLNIHLVGWFGSDSGQNHPPAPSPGPLPTMSCGELHVFDYSALKITLRNMRWTRCSQNHPSYKNCLERGLSYAGIPK